MSRRCPACPGALELTPMEAAATTLDWCSACGGTWVDASDWTAVFPTPRGKGEPTGRQRGLACPACAEVALRTLALPGEPAVEVDACDRCGGAWLDAGEMAALRRRGGSGTAAPSAVRERTAHAPAAVPDAISALERPHTKYWSMTLLQGGLASLATLGLALPLVLIGLIPTYIRYATTRYSFDDEGVGVSWGFLFRHATYITFGKIQDIHLNRGLLERWFGLGTVEVQTAAGSSSAEISLFGLTEFDAVRDYLYARMRGTKGERPAAGEARPDDALALLTAIRDEVTLLRRAVEERGEAAS